MTLKNDITRSKELKIEIDHKRDKINDILENGPTDDTFYVEDCEYIDEVLAEIAAEKKEIEILERELALEEERETQLNHLNEEAEEENEAEEKIVINAIIADTMKWEEFFNTFLIDELAALARSENWPNKDNINPDISDKIADLLKSRFNFNKESHYSPFRFFPKPQLRAIKDLLDEDTLHKGRKY